MRRTKNEGARRRSRVMVPTIHHHHRLFAESQPRALSGLLIPFYFDCISAPGPISFFISTRGPSMDRKPCCCYAFAAHLDKVFEDLPIYSIVDPTSSTSWLWCFLMRFSNFIFLFLSPAPFQLAAVTAAVVDDLFISRKRRGREIVYVYSILPLDTEMLFRCSRIPAPILGHLLCFVFGSPPPFFFFFPLRSSFPFCLGWKGRKERMRRTGT